MKLSATLLIAILFAAMSGTAETTGNLVLPDLSQASVAVLTVHGLSCPLCANNLDGRFKRVKGVVSSKIDLSNGTVTVKLKKDHAVTSEQLVKAVADSGFTAVNIKAVD